MLNEFRQDLVSGDWVLFATGRAKGHVKNPQPFYQPKDGCVFDNPQKSGQGNPLLVYYKGNKISWEGDSSGQWTTQVIVNKFPAVKSGVCGPLTSMGPFQTAGAFGFHEIVITKDHDRTFAQLTTEEIAEVLAVYRERFLAIAQSGDCGEYVSIFHNHGPAAGASIYHNHSQILSSPIIPPEVLRSIRGAEEYYMKHHKKVHEVLIDWEMSQRKRIVYENKSFVVFCPFVSKTPYEMRIFPKNIDPRFEAISVEDVHLLADALGTVLRKMHKALDDPDYNFYIHTSPVAKDPILNYEYYHWHLEVVPRVSVVGGVELSTDVYVNVIDPDEAADLIGNTTI